MRAWILLAPMMGTSCLTLDGFVFGGTPCPDVGPETCNDDPFDSLCVTCDEPYDWQRDYEWLPGTLEPGQTIRPVADADVRNVSFELNGGVADAVFLAGHGPNADITILYNHGNYANLEHYAPRLRMLHEAGYSVFAWDYRGFGKTTPYTYPTPDEFMADAAAAREAVVVVAPDPDRIVVYGYSLGAIPAVEQAVTQPGCALILETPFPSLQNFAEGTTTLTLRDQMISEGRYDNVQKIEGHSGPLLAMAGQIDGLIPADWVVELAEHNGGPTDTWVVEGSEHGISTGGVPEMGLTTYFDRIAAFLDTTSCR